MINQKELYFIIKNRGGKILLHACSNVSLTSPEECISYLNSITGEEIKEFQKPSKKFLRDSKKTEREEEQEKDSKKTEREEEQEKEIKQIKRDLFRWKKKRIDL